MREDRIHLLKGISVGALVGTVVGLGGFFLSNYPKIQGMGSVMFLVTPILAGFAIALVTRKPNTMRAAMFLAVLASLLFLVAAGFEGTLCAVLAFPFLAAGLAIGALLGGVFRKSVVERFRNRGATIALFLGITPAIILAGHQAEYRSLNRPREEVVTNSVLISATPDHVWGHIQSIDSIDAPKPWLMYIGLPVPLRCTLQKTGVGAKRICYFNNGSIEEIITEWSPPSRMRLSIDRTNMPGRHWLGFEDAVYELKPEGTSTRLTRTTTIISHLQPVWYWRYFECLGVSSEHEYILNDLKRRLSNDGARIRRP